MIARVMQGTDIGWVLWVLVGVYVALGALALAIEWRRVKR